MNSAEKKFQARLLSHSQEFFQATPGLVVQAYEEGRLKLDVRIGEQYPYYDLASLTKIIFTGTALAREFKRGLLSSEDRVGDFWPEFPHPKITLHELMTHTAGLPWWKPFYKQYRSERKPEWRWQEMGRKLEKIPRIKSKRAVYSDPDVWILGQILTRVKRQSLHELWDNLRDYSPTGQMHFNIGSKREKPKKSYAPTERCVWRKRILQGEVHDENAWALGGIAPHAGLFGRVEDVAQWANWVRKNTKLFQQFTRRQVPATIGDWGYLFMKPTAGKASCGKYFSKDSFGHTGFTGTSVWMDPKKDRTVIILSNRVHPTRKNQRFLAWRAVLHDWICESL